MKWYAVIGRIPGDDEDTCYVYETSSIELAAEMFELDMYDEHGDEREEVKQAKLQHYGAAIFITNVLESDTQIRDTGFQTWSAP